MRVILISMRANLIPIQLRGPQPKGMWHTAGRLAFSSGVNLRKGGKDRGKTREEGRKENITFLGQISLVLASILDCVGGGGWGVGQLIPWEWWLSWSQWSSEQDVRFCTRVGNKLYNILRRSMHVFWVLQRTITGTCPVFLCCLHTTPLIYCGKGDLMKYHLFDILCHGNWESLSWNTHVVQWFDIFSLT